MERFPSDVWVVEGGELRRMPLREGSDDTRFDLCTKREFANFELEFEWKIARGGNSGVKYLVREDRPPSWEQVSYEYSRDDLIRRGMRDSDEFRKLSPERVRYSPIGFEFQILDDSVNGDARNGSHRRTGALYDLLGPTTRANAPANQFNQGRIMVEGSRVEHWVNGVKVLEYDRTGEPLAERIRKSKFARMAGFGANPAGRITLQDHGEEAAFRNIRIRELANPGRGVSVPR
jgi:hypothetical protein